MSGLTNHFVSINNTDIEKVKRLKEGLLELRQDQHNQYLNNTRNGRRGTPEGKIDHVLY